MDRPIAQRIRHELKFRLAEVVSNERLTPHVVRITFTDPSFSDFPSLAYDDHVKLFFPPEGTEPSLPVPGPNGLDWPEGMPKPEGRDYTPRRFDAARREVVIDFVVHDGGVAAAWAERAKPGDRLGIGGPRASFVIPDNLQHYVLIGDETALPAIGRRIEELPGTATVRAFMEIADERERQSFDTAARVEITWVERAKGQSLIEVVQAAADPEPESYIFIAGEASMSTMLRDAFVQRGHDPELIKAAGYWRRGEADFDDGHAH
ncbi:NADPH-dependent ferric siderophore reductase, contains FAD-binding and SIP domains [Devosia lucknowensis]|uniref:NADPH-dependent ferric siderophore reductase, contains FAD-binding and SIP domains n=1 Tax=Devosia lucknowensis TaxID=1096929 RepID=A0A1Y6G5T4_9HYPH|nr:siderophore-interacting protein [Devosia lucknowensis]SMQ85436.1 NADPH-dependent ferric siderophore reductase, contains FAD-binding and SIP domains [Devosia lucknowensis]